MIHYQQSRTTWHYKKGDRVRLLCEDMIGWHKRNTFCTSMSKITCPACMKKLVKKKLKECLLNAERCGINFSELLEKVGDC